MNDIIRFYEKTRTVGECLEWTGTRIRGGYGRFMYGSRYKQPRRRLWLSHRWIWTYKHGPVPDGKDICHSCDNPPCVKISHLWIGTRSENVLDSYRKGRQANKHGEFHPQAKMSERDVFDLCRLHDLGMSLVDLSNKYGINKSHAWRLANGRSWQHLKKREWTKEI